MTERIRELSRKIDVVNSTDIVILGAGRARTWRVIMESKPERQALRGRASVRELIQTWKGCQ